MKRKLGAKNRNLFIFMILLFIGIIGIFGYFIKYEMTKEANTYEVASGSILYDYKNNFIELKNNGVIKKGFDGKYYVTYKDENDISKKQRIGNNTISYKEGDYKLYFYGPAYMISKTGEVEKLSGQTEIVKSASPYFLKISDRKYIFIDKKLTTSDNSIKTKDYLYIELDKQGNATFINFENNIKTIKPLILKGTQYDFDIANEKLILGKNNEINLKDIIGSTNQYVKNNDSKTKENTGNSDNSYYDDYLKTIKTSFNNLVGSINGINDNIQGELNKEDAYLDLTRWTTLKSTTSTVNSLDIKYSVFDPNNEFSEVFVIIEKDDYKEKIQLSKTIDTYSVSNLLPDTEYDVKYGYRVVAAVGDPTIDVIIDDVKVKTLSLDYQINITKITSKNIFYNVVFSNNFIPDSAEIGLFSDGNKVESITILKSQIDENGVYSGSKQVGDTPENSGIYNGKFDFETIDNIVSLKMYNIVYDSKPITYTTYAKFAN